MLRSRKTSRYAILPIFVLQFDCDPSRALIPAPSYLTMPTKWLCTENPSRNANLLQLRLTLRGVSRLLVGRFGPYFELRARNDPLKTFSF